MKVIHLQAARIRSVTIAHRAADCEKQPLCGICLESKHPVANCPFLIFSANVSNDEEDTNYANAVRPDSVVRVRKNISKPPAVSSDTPRPPVSERSERASSHDKGEKDKGQNKSQDKSHAGSGNDKGSKSTGSSNKSSSDKDCSDKSSRDQSSRDKSSKDDDRSDERRGKKRSRSSRSRRHRDYSPPFYSSDNDYDDCYSRR